jgi:DNA polymerase I-like protein with 3'-5' exonuclease and polymerase domains
MRSQPISTRPPAASTRPIQPGLACSPGASRPTIRTSRTSRSAPSDGRKIRTAFVAAPGKTLISADYSARSSCSVLAHIADIQALKDAFEEGLDIHAMTASEMFNVPVEGMPSDVRRRAKAINFGIIYGISAFGLANQLGIERGVAGDYIKTYFERFPGIRAYMDAQKIKVKADGFVTTIFRPQNPVPQRQFRQSERAQPLSNAPPSTPPSRALPPTSFAAP